MQGKARGSDSVDELLRIGIWLIGVIFLYLNSGNNEEGEHLNF
jgi:hypothetical protein